MPLPLGCHQRWNVCGGRCGADARHEPNSSRRVPSRGIGRRAAGGTRSPPVARQSAVEADFVGVLDIRVQVLQADDREVMPLDFEGVGGAAQHLDLTQLIGLHPDGGVGLADMAQ